MPADDRWERLGGGATRLAFEQRRRLRRFDQPVDQVEVSIAAKRFDHRPGAFGARLGELLDSCGQPLEQDVAVARRTQLTAEPAELAPQSRRPF
jgi:hypothetical protein